MSNDCPSPSCEQNAPTYQNHGAVRTAWQQDRERALLAKAMQQSFTQQANPAINEFRAARELNAGLQCPSFNAEPTPAPLDNDGCMNFSGPAIRKEFATTLTPLELATKLATDIKKLCENNERANAAEHSTLAEATAGAMQAVADGDERVRICTDREQHCVIEFGSDYMLDGRLVKAGDYFVETKTLTPNGIIVPSGWRHIEHESFLEHYRFVDADEEQKTAKEQHVARLAARIGKQSNEMDELRGVILRLQNQLDSTTKEKNALTQKLSNHSKAIRAAHAVLGVAERC